MKIAQMNFRALQAHVAGVSFYTFMEQFHPICKRLTALSTKTRGDRLGTLISIALDNLYQGDPEAKRRCLDHIAKRLEPSIVDQVAKLDDAAKVGL